MSIGEAAKRRAFCCADVAVSIGEAARVLLRRRRRVYRRSCKTSCLLLRRRRCVYKGSLQNFLCLAAEMLPCL